MLSQAAPVSANLSAQRLSGLVNRVLAIQPLWNLASMRVAFFPLNHLAGEVCSQPT